MNLGLSISVAERFLQYLAKVSRRWPPFLPTAGLMVMFYVLGTKGYVYNEDEFIPDQNCVSLDSARRSRNCTVSVSGRRGCIYLHESFEESELPFRCIVDIQRMTETNCGIRIKVFNTSLGFRDANGTCTGDALAVDSCVPEGGARFCGNILDEMYEFPFQTNASAFRLLADFNTSSNITRLYFHYELISDCERKNVLFWRPHASNFPEANGSTSMPCYVRIDERRGTINSPWFPETYPENMDCIYDFYRTDDGVCGIRLTTESFELENPTTTALGLACADFFQTPGCGFVCGTIKFSWVIKYQPGASSITFHFHSDEDRSERGFQLQFEQLRCSTEDNG